MYKMTGTGMAQIKTKQSAGCIRITDRGAQNAKQTATFKL
jgi:hypothetical protein